ncbi:MAG TPA: polyprenol monophosphomannose synthase [bacterium]|nr:polyprenol monophosphomannose synthase [bacterium]
MKSAKRILIIVPTYNEVENIREIVPAILKQDRRIEILVVDDNSPDGTGSVVEQMIGEEPRLNILKRAGKMGLATAYLDGFRWALAQDFDFIFEMDADFSHSPDALSGLIAAAAEADLVIGSRYLKGMNVVNWPFRRLLLSCCANLYTRCVTRLPIKDCTSGFKCFRRRVLEALDFDRIHTDGYAFQIEMTYKAWKKGFRLVEVPIIFYDRRAGESKMSSGIISEAALEVWKLRLHGLFGKL